MSTRSEVVKTIGLLGGLTWESTIEYYRLINEGVRDKLGGLHSARIVMHSLDFAKVEHLQQINERERIPELHISRGVPGTATVPSLSSS